MTVINDLIYPALSTPIALLPPLGGGAFTTIVASWIYHLLAFGMTILGAV